MVVSCRVIAYCSIAFFRVANGFEILHFVFAIVFFYCGYITESTVVLQLCFDASLLGVVSVLIVILVL